LLAITKPATSPTHEVSGVRRRSTADYLVTGNQRHLPKFWKKIKVITSRDLVTGW